MNPTSRRSRTIASPIVAVVSTLILAAGCAKPGDPGLLQGYDPTQLLGAEHPAVIAVDPTLTALTAGERHFATVEDDVVTALMTMTVAPAGLGLWRSDFSGDRASIVQVDNAGVMLLETTDYANRAVTTFEPPLPLITGTLAPGAEVKGHYTVIVRSLADAARIVDRGTAAQTLTRLDDQEVLLPDGVVHRSARFRRVLTLDLGRADVEETSTAWYVPGLGLAVEESEEKVKALGILSWTKQRLLVRVP